MLLIVRSQCGGFVGNGGRKRRMSPRSGALLKERLMVSDGQCRGFTEGGRADMYGADIIRVGQWQDVRDLSGKTLVEKDVEEQGRKNTPLQHSPFDGNNEVARGGGIADNAFVAEQHTCHNFNGCNGKAGTSKREKKMVVPDCVKRLGDVEGEQMDRAATTVRSMKIVGK